MTDICIFPIPDCVTFPGTVFPLHVFEPRYRKMIQHCLDTQTPVAICHTQKLLSPAKPNQDPHTALHSNQATYKPYPIFSAGQPELLKALDDGRLLLNIHIRQRYRAIAEKQTLPYMVYDCEPFLDLEADPDDHDYHEELKQRILKRLDILAFRQPEFQAVYQAHDWQTKPVNEFSFQLFGLIAFDADTQQQLLAMDTITDRLERALELLLGID
ncbi:LON peptidase substrate-binding domain-containing protein [Oceanobacter sp. 4_MG-2023]|uniref:LON peptidase substrate-binding domain-containing protein n=1 Tax=Oceanobacter sp. 4_MG-2023 TaxID=3062623 RepID=UPI002736A2E1|nr:LON peptidase substrate-binding domain-containing protein [Oceanobacter sp. 4_MG-2023]MDP2546890.1 LON peptidase substrate-binding domain-containing protein [Oceanobacter sp. 4_MG-2023]